MKNKVAIIHLLPLELYPPVMNLLDCLSESKPELQIIVFSTKVNMNLSTYENSNIQVERYPPIIQTSSKYNKFYRYAVFYISTFNKLIKFKPSKVLYFEIISALPALWYKRIWKSIDIFAHYHEIVPVKDLQKNRTIENYINKIEKKQYSTYKWISQTNTDRLNIFNKLYDFAKDSNNLKVLPNYPPVSWVKKPITVQKQQDTIKLLYIGSLSLSGTYLLQLLNKFGSNPKFSIDFYSHNMSTDVKKAISKHHNCHIKEAIDYKDIQKLKGIYDIGLVMYKDHSVNYKYNAPNKLFEYLALDLDVWCSNKLVSARDYERLDCYPKVLMVDYENLKDFNVENALDKTNLHYQPSPYTCDKIYANILDMLHEKQAS